MSGRARALFALVALLSAAPPAAAEVFIRWDRDRVPPSQRWGATGLVMRVDNTAGIRAALAEGYRVWLEVPAKAAGGFTPPAQGLEGIFVDGSAPAAQLSQLRQRLKLQVRVLEQAAKWPHIRSNAVRRSNEVLQIAGRSQQPWIETNGALVRMRDPAGLTPPVLTYRWTPATLTEADEGPPVENYLVAIAEAAAFGADLVLPLHDRFQQNLLLDRPQALGEWEAIQLYLDFYSLAGRRVYEPMANIAVVTAQPTRWFEVMNLLVRHNLPFRVIGPDEIAAPALEAFAVLIVLDELRGAPLEAVAAFERQGGSVVRPSAAGGVGDPNGFAMKIRSVLGRERRMLDIWNGITVLVAPYQEADGRTVLLKLTNYAHQPLPVQLRVRGLFSAVHFECPEAAGAMLEYEHRDGYTEFVIPSLRVGGRVLLSRER